MIGNVNIPHTVTGSPFGTNFIRVERLDGPGGSPVAIIAESPRFLVAGKLIDFPPPAVQVTDPVAGTVLGTIPVTATATDHVGVTSLQIQLDGHNLGLAGTASPLTVSWDTTGVPNGLHRLSATASDAAG